MKTVLLIVTAILVFGCATKQDSASSTDIYPAPSQIGDYTKKDVEHLRLALGRLAFPVVEGTLARLLPRPIKATPLRFSDYRPDAENKGRMGGNIVEYWLNESQVLQVASAYYARGEKHFTMEEWAVVMTRSERDRFSRPIYPGDFVIRIAP